MTPEPITTLDAVAVMETVGGKEAVIATATFFDTVPPGPVQVKENVAESAMESMSEPDTGGLLHDSGGLSMVEFPVQVDAPCVSQVSITGSPRGTLVGVAVSDRTGVRILAMVNGMAGVQSLLKAPTFKV